MFHRNALRLAAASLALLPAAALAQDATTGTGAVAAATAVAGSTSSNWAIALAFLGAALGTALPCWGSAQGVSLSAQAGSGLLTEKPELAGRVITLSVLPGSQGLYGMVISLLFLFSYAGPLLSGEVQLDMAGGLALFAAFLPVAIAAMTSAPWQGRICAVGMHLLAKDTGLMGRVITLAALVETYALLGFLISFFMLNNLRDSLLTVAS